MWLYSFNTRSAYDKINRAIQAKKFYKTLPAKIDNAVEDCIEEMEVLKEPTEVIKEVGIFGEDGWSISKSASFFEKDDT